MINLILSVETIAGMVFLTLLWLWLFRELFNGEAKSQLESLRTQLFIDCAKNGWLYTDYYREADAFVKMAQQLIPSLSAWYLLAILRHHIRQVVLILLYRVLHFVHTLRGRSNDQDGDLESRQTSNVTARDEQLSYFQKFDLYVIRVVVDSVVKHSLILRAIKVIYRITIKGRTKGLPERPGEDLPEQRAPGVKKFLYEEMAPTAGHHVQHHSPLQCVYR